MALARRSITSTYTSLSRRFHPSFSHFIPDVRDRERDSSPPAPQHHSSLFSSSAAAVRGLARERSGLGFHLPLGLDTSIRWYSSSPQDPPGAEYLKDTADVLSDKGAALADVLTEKGLDIAQNSAPALGEVAVAAADSAPPVAALQHLIDLVHSSTGLDWWVAIAISTVLIRLATVPLMIQQLKATARLSLLRPELEELKANIQNSDDPQVLTENQKRMTELFKRHGVTPFTPLKGLFITGPVFISFFWTISNMVQKVPSFKEGGAFWFTDLTTADSFIVLPILTSLAFLITVEFNMQEGMEGNPMAITLKKFSRAFGVLMVPLTVSFPKAIFFYWITSNLFSLTYGIVLRRPTVRKLLNLPGMTPGETPASASSPFGGSTDSIASAASLSAPLLTQQSESLDETVPSGSPDGTLPSSVISQRLHEIESTAKERNKEMQ